VDSTLLILREYNTQGFTLPNAIKAKRKLDPTISDLNGDKA
jgi:hypothetical protein